MTERDDLLAAKVEHRQETSILERLEVLGQGQTQIFDEQHAARMRGLAVFLVGLLVAALLGWYVNENHSTLAEFQRQRGESRIGLCYAIDDMRGKHNDFVDTVIAERQALIDSTNASTTATDSAKAVTVLFFQGQIDAYRKDLNVIVNCDDPAAVAGLFTAP